MTTGIDVLHHLERELRAGRVVAFIAVGIDAADNTRIWSFGPTKSRIQMRGAMKEMEIAYDDMQKKGDKK